MVRFAGRTPVGRDQVAPLQRLHPGGDMVRKLAMAVSLAVGSALTLPVYALGLGEIRTSSALNENFKGEIELLSVEKGQLDTLKVELAPAEVFARTGVERPFLLSRLRFKAVRKRNGKAVILVSSDVPIREPFLDFFVQVTWPQGKLVREYTVLLDPPVTTHRRAPRVKQASSRAKATTVAPVTSSAAPEVAPGGDYGPVQANETLWQIAERIRPRGVSVHQMMVALYRANPDAFLHGNINLLKKGRVLHVPELAELRSIGRREALAEFQRLANAGNAAALARTEPAAPPTVEEGQSQEQVERQGEQGVEAAPEEGGRLRIAGVEKSTTGEPGAAEQTGEGGEDVQALKQKLLLVEEQAATARQEADDLKERMAALEKQLQDMKRLLTLRNQELAQLQAQAATGGATAAAPMEEAIAETQPEAAPTEQPQPETTSLEAEPPEVSTAPMPTVDAPQPTEESIPAGAPVVVESPMQPAEEVQRGGESAAEESLPAKSEQTSEEVTEPAATQIASEPEKKVPATDGTEEKGLPYWQQWLTDNWQMAAGGGALVLALIGLAAVRRRKAGEEQELPPSAAVAQAPSSQAQTADASVEQGAPAEGAAGMEDSAMGDTSFLSEYSTEELRALHEDTTEVDPVSEADVYIAYGRYSQAEEILQEAMKNGDQSAAVRHKMLEVYYATQKKDEFRKLAEQMVADGQDKEDPKMWEHVQTMGRDLDRSNPLFAAAAAAGAMAAAADSDLEEQDSDLSLDLSTLAEEVDSQLNPDSESLEAFSNLDLELPSLQIEPEVRDEEAGQGSQGDDLKLHETELHTELADLSDLGDLEVDATTLDETLADLAGDLEGVMADSRIIDQPLDIEQSALDELESLAVSEPLDSPLEDKEPVKDSQIGDEVETKLELAKAFLEIGDADGARSILQEVQADGTPQQKESAAELLAQIDG